MSETKKKYPGLSNNIKLLLHKSPNKDFDIGEIRKSFMDIEPSLLAYHLKRLQLGGLASNPKRGYWRACADDPIGKARAHVESVMASGKPSVVNGEGWTHGTAEAIKAVIPVETEWTWYLERHMESIKKRMKSSAPATEVFTLDDAGLLDKMFFSITKKAKAYIAQQSGYAVKE